MRSDDTRNRTVEQLNDGIVDTLVSDGTARYGERVPEACVEHVGNLEMAVAAVDAIAVALNQSNVDFFPGLEVRITQARVVIGTTPQRPVVLAP